MKTIDLLRHTANDGDRLSEDGIRAAVEIGKSIGPDYSMMASSGAQRATQTVACILAGSGHPVEGGVIVVDDLRSTVEDRWRAAYEYAGAGDLASLREADPDLVTDDSETLAAGLRELFALLPEGGRALAVGHSPTNEAAVYGLTGQLVDPLGRGEGVTITEEAGAYSVRE